MGKRPVIAIKKTGKEDMTLRFKSDQMSFKRKVTPETNSQTSGHEEHPQQASHEYICEFRKDTPEMSFWAYHLVPDALGFPQTRVTGHARTLTHNNQHDASTTTAPTQPHVIDDQPCIVDSTVYPWRVSTDGEGAKSLIIDQGHLEESYGISPSDSVAFAAEVASVLNESDPKSFLKRTATLAEKWPKGLSTEYFARRGWNHTNAFYNHLDTKSPILSKHDPESTISATFKDDHAVSFTRSSYVPPRKALSKKLVPTQFVPYLSEVRLEMGSSQRAKETFDAFERDRVAALGRESLHVRLGVESRA